MNSGVIGVFRESTESKNRCSISVRAGQSRDELEKQFKKEHPNIDIFLDKIFTFECKDNRTDVETALRAVLVQAFGPYTQYKNWDNYVVEDYDKFIAFIGNVFQLTKNVITVQEIEHG